MSKKNGKSTGAGVSASSSAGAAVMDAPPVDSPVSDGIDHVPAYDGAQEDESEEQNDGANDVGFGDANAADGTQDAEVDDDFERQRAEYRDAGPLFVWQTPLADIVVDPTRNGRSEERKLTDKDVKELAASIRERGQMSPGELTFESDGRLHLDVGFGRYAALQLLEKEGPEGRLFAAFVRVPEGDEKTERINRRGRNFDENDKRKELGLLDRVKIVSDYIADGMKQAEVVAQTGLTKSQVSNYAKINQWPDETKALIASGKLTATAAVNLCPLPVDKVASEANKLVAAAGDGTVGVTAAKKAKRAANTGKAATSQLSMKEFVDALDFFLSPANRKQLHKSTEEQLRIIGDLAYGRIKPESALKKLAAYQ